MSSGDINSCQSIQSITECCLSSTMVSHGHISKPGRNRNHMSGGGFIHKHCLTLEQGGHSKPYLTKSVPNLFKVYGLACIFISIPTPNQLRQLYWQTSGSILAQQAPHLPSCHSWALDQDGHSLQYPTKFVPNLSKVWV